MGHKRDWTQYNKQLVNRGKIHFWASPKALKNWQAKKQKKNGHPFVYSNELIKDISFTSDSSFGSVCEKQKGFLVRS